MSDVKHTPGPWRYRKFYEYGETAGFTVCAIVGIADVPGIEPEDEANARLIAAAPELLESLRTLLEHAQEKYPHFESERGQRDIGIATSAIAKAEGRIP